MKSKLTIITLKSEIPSFIMELTKRGGSKDLYEKSDGKTIGTYIEKEFKTYLEKKYSFKKGSSAKDIDFPEIKVDVKTTSVKKPQSSTPYKSPEQKIYGLGHHLIVFVYNRIVNESEKTAYLKIEEAVFIDAKHTSDYEITNQLRGLLAEGAQIQQVEDFLSSQGLLLNDKERKDLAQKIFNNPPEQGYLTMSDALQWRLNYGKTIGTYAKDDSISSVVSLLS